MKVKIDKSQELKNKNIFSFTITGETEENNLIKYVKESSETKKCQASEIRQYGIKLLDTLSEFIPKELLEDMYHNVNSYRSDEDIVQ